MRKIIFAMFCILAILTTIPTAVMASGITVTPETIYVGDQVTFSIPSTVILWGRWCGAPFPFPVIFSIYETDWNFGDGSSATLWFTSSATHMYETAGVHEVTTHAIYRHRFVCPGFPPYWMPIPRSYSVTIVVQPPLDVINPVADAGPDQIVFEGTTVTFDGSASSDNVGITDYTWTFIDVTTKTLHGEKPTYTFNTPGVYTVTLKVTDAAGNWDTDTVVITVVITATIDIDPDTLNLKSKGKWITCYIELPSGYDVNNIDLSTILLNHLVPAQLEPTEIGDYDEDTIPDLMVKFNRADVCSLLSLGNEVEITITGALVDGIHQFEGSDTIRVISEGKT